MPLTFAELGERNIVKKVGGSDEVRQHLADLGFVVGSEVSVVSTMGGNIMTDAFGIVAMVAMTPLITIQCIGLYSNLRQRARRKQKIEAMGMIPDGLVYYDYVRTQDA